jgi:hypothetical protein
MSNGQTIRVSSDQDIIRARMLVRELARIRGLSVRDQAFISMATSSLAQVLCISARGGKILIESFKQDGRIGLRVTCSSVGGNGDDRPSATFGETQRMVDVFTVERLPSNEIRVKMVKWSTR